MVHVPIAAETLFHIGPVEVTNAMINSGIVTVIFVALAIAVSFTVKEIPGRFQSGLEMLVETLLSYFDKVTNDREKSKRFLPLVGTFFLFILLSNWMGLLPGTGSIGLWREMHGEAEFFPLLRPANSDLNLTLALALVSVVASHLFGIITLGIFVHLNKFIQLGTLAKALKSLNPVKILVACVEFIVGLIEIFGELAKVASLSLRLFGNIFAGEVLMTVISSLIAVFVPLPFMGIEILVGIVQATVFSLLTLVYLTVMTMQPHGAHAEEEHGTSAAH